VLALSLAPLRLAAQGPAVSGAFLTRLGSDTVALERYSRSATRLEGEAIVRAPVAQAIAYTVTVGPGGAVAGLESVTRRVGDPPGAAPLRRIRATFTGDSAIVETTQGGDTQTRRIALRGEVLPFITVFIQAPYELGLARLRPAAGGADSVSLTNSANATPTIFRRARGDSVVISAFFGSIGGRADGEGRLLALDGRGSTVQITVERLPAVDLAAFAAASGGRALGQLSPRDTARAALAGGAAWVDYGRPSRRGRVIFGNVVSWNQVWRTGANRATHFTTAADLVMGGVRVPAGTYTLWTLPSPAGWKLIVNRQTDQWGTEYHAEQDLARIDMTVETLPSPMEQFTIAIEARGSGGVLSLSWDTTRASVPLTSR
jgi:hypothetical protein